MEEPTPEEETIRLLLFRSPAGSLGRLSSVEVVVVVVVVLVVIIF
jgi:hypothetical protein